MVYDDEKIKQASHYVRSAYLKKGTSKHRWRSTVGTWQYFFTDNMIDSLYKVHADVFRAMGYDAPEKNSLSIEDVQKNIKKYW